MKAGVPAIAGKLTSLGHVITLLSSEIQLQTVCKNYDHSEF